MSLGRWPRWGSPRRAPKAPLCFSRHTVPPNCFKSANRFVRLDGMPDLPEIFAKHSQTETILHRLAKRCGNGFDLHER